MTYLGRKKSRDDLPLTEKSQEKHTFKKGRCSLSPFNQDNCVHSIAIKKSKNDSVLNSHSQKKSRDDLPWTQKSKYDLTFFRVGVCQLSN